MRHSADTNCVAKRLAATAQQVVGTGDNGRSLNTLYTSYIDGEPEGKALDKMRRKVLPYIRSRLAFADNATIIDYLKLMVEQYIVLQSVDPKLCFEYAAGTSPNFNFIAYFPPALTAREMALDERVIETADPTAHAKPTDAELQPYQATIYRRLLARFPKSTVDVIFKDKVETTDYDPYCNVSITMFQEIEHLGDPGAVILMRNILSQ
jgi:hypothetical protein